MVDPLKNPASGTGLTVIIKKTENRDPLCYECGEYSDTWIERKRGEKLPICFECYNRKFVDKVLYDDSQDGPKIWTPKDWDD